MGRRFGDDTAETRPLTQLLDGVVDAVFTGHEHIYQRFLPLQYDGVRAPSGEYGLDADDGVLYLVTPAAGYGHLETELLAADDPEGEQLEYLAWPELPPTKDEGDAAEAVNAEGIHGYLVGEVTPTSLTVSFVGMGNSAEPAEASVRDSVVVAR